MDNILTNKLLEQGRHMGGHNYLPYRDDISFKSVMLHSMRVILYGSIRDYIDMLLRGDPPNKVLKAFEKHYSDRISTKKEIIDRYRSELVSISLTSEDRLLHTVVEYTNRSIRELQTTITEHKCSRNFFRDWKESIGKWECRNELELAAQTMSVEELEYHQVRYEECIADNETYINNHTNSIRMVTGNDIRNRNTDEKINQINYMTKELEDLNSDQLKYRKLLDMAVSFVERLEKI